MIWTAFNLLFWQSPSTWQNVGVTHNVLNSQAQFLHGLTIIGVDLLFIWLGHYLGQRNIDYSAIVRFISQMWLMVVGTGTLMMIVGIVKLQFTKQIFYQTLLPIGQNTSPLLTGLLLGLILVKLSREISTQAQPWLKLILWILIILPTLSGHDIFNFNSGSNSLLYALLMTLGAFPTRQSRRRLAIIGSLSVVIGFAGLIVIPITAMLFNEINGTQISPSRMTTAANAFLVIFAWAMVHIIESKNTDKLADAPRWHMLYWIGLGLFLSQSPLTSSLFTSLVKGNLSNTRLNLISFVSAVSLTILAFVMIFVWQLIWRWTNLTSKIAQVTQNPQLTNPSEWYGSLRRFLIKHWNILLALLFSYGLAALSLLAMNISRDNHWHHVLTYTFTVRNLMVLFNTLLVFALFEFLWTLSRHYWFALGVTSAVSLAWIIASALKILSRGEPIMPSELKMVSNWFNIIKMSGFGTVIAAIVLIVITVLLIVIFEHWLPQEHHQTISRVIFWILLFPVLIGSSFFWNHQPLMTFSRGIGNDPQFYKQIWGAEANGPLVQLLDNIDIQVMKRPHDYNKATMLKIRQRYQKAAQEINQHRHNKLADQTIIFNLSESFADPRRVPGVQLKQKPITQIDKIKQNNTSGLMLSSGYGGGTANMEYMTLTGFSMGLFSSTLTTPFTQLVGNLTNNPSILGYFRHSTAIHPFTGTFYNRDTVYKKFGFNRFYSLNGHYRVKHKHYLGNNTYVDDQSAYENVNDQLKRRHRGQFINLITMQNHLPYSNLYKNSGRFLKVSPATVDQDGLRNFTIGINYTDKAVNNFIKGIDRIYRPITIVFYGDHLPGLYGSLLNSNWLQLHKTDYFIYSNRYARQHGATQKLTHNTAYVSPNDFMALAAEQTNSKVNWYLALLTRVQHRMPANLLNSQGNAKSTNLFVNQHGQTVTASSLTKKQRQLWHDYQLVQYDVTSGKHYLVRGGQLK